MRPQVGIVVAVVVLAFGGSGCFDQMIASERIVPDGPLTRAEYIEEANAVCVREMLNVGNMASGDLDDALSGDPARVVEAVYRPLREDTDDQVKALRMLPVPEGDEEELEAIFAAFEAIVAHLDEVLATGDPQLGATDPDAPDPLTSLIRWRAALLDGYGITDCG